MSLRWDDLKLFLAVHEHGSLSGAARALKLGQPTLSRRIAELEESVGEALFARQSHGSHLTDLGLQLLPAAQAMAQWAHEAELNVSPKTSAPKGRVRISAPAGIAYALLAPMAAHIRQQHPLLQIEVLSGVETLNLARGEADISLRTQRPTDADLVCVDEVASPMRVFVSQAYAARLGPSPALEDLDWICWAPPYDELRTNVELRNRIPGFAPAFTSDDYIVQIAACRAGAGAMVLPQVFSSHARQQDLLALDLVPWPQAKSLLYVVCHKRRRHLANVQLVLDCLSSEFKRLRGGGEHPLQGYGVPRSQLKSPS